MIRQCCGLLFLLAAFSLASCRSVNDTAGGNHEPLPEGWRLDDISEAEPAEPGQTPVFEAQGAYVLAWKISQEERPGSPLEECLLLKRFAKPDGEQRWVLAAVVRKPPQEKWRVRYVLAMMPRKVDMPSVCTSVYYRRTYQKCPTNGELYAFMDEFDWRLEPPKGWWLLRGQVCRDTWRDVIGEEPTRFFPPH
jgi:hypothetical protein